MAIQKTYRHAKTGVERDYPPTIARRFPELIELVDEPEPIASAIPQPSVEIDVEDPDLTTED